MSAVNCRERHFLCFRVKVNSCIVAINNYITKNCNDMELQVTSSGLFRAYTSVTSSILVI